MAGQNKNIIELNTTRPGIPLEQNHLKEAKAEISMQDKISHKIKSGIKTERYQKLEEWDIEGFHLDGEEW